MLNNLEIAKSKLALYCNEFVSLLCKLDLVPAPVGTAATDGRNLFYDEPWLLSLPVAEVAGVLIHELIHNMLAHPAQMMSHNWDKDLENKAMDIVINQMVDEYAEEIKSKSQGAFVIRLPDIAIKGPQFDKYKGWNYHKVYQDLKQSGKGKSKSIKQFDEVRPGTNPDGSPMNKEQAEALGREWAMAAQQAAQIAKARGMQSGFFESFVAGLTKTRVDWQAHVRDICTKAAKEDQSYRRFNRKLISSRIYLPGMYSETLGPVLFAADTSGSMNDESFKLALGGMNEIMADLKPEKIWFMCCDTEIKSVEELTPDDLPVQAKGFKGRGGTTLTPMFKWACEKEKEEELAMVVILTDGGCETVDKKWEPRCPVVWLVCTDDMAAPQGSFGKVLRV